MDTNPRRRDELKKVAEQAAEWLGVLEECGATERGAFARWIAESPLHVQAFLRATAIDRLLDGVDGPRRMTVIPQERASAVSCEGSALETRFKRRWQWAAGAAVLLLAVSGWLARNFVDGHRYVTARGEQRSVELSDGSVVHINTSSQVEVKYFTNARELRLLSGEALFNVQHDPARPFRVHADGFVIQAIGTQFNVYRHDGIATISVVDGAVQISREDDEASIARVEAGETATIESTGTVQRPLPADLTRVIAWRQRRLVFERDSLADIAAEFNRYNRTRQIRVEGDAVRARRYAAVFDADDPESLLQFLAKDPTLRFERDADELVIRSR